MKIKIVIAVLLVIVAIGAFIYFVSGVSATLPPIKQYEYEGNINQLITKMRAFASTQPHLDFKIDDTLGDKSRGYPYEIIIKVKSNSHDLLYELKFEGVNDAKSKTIIKLIGAHDLTNDTGGYGMKATGMNMLLDTFDSDVVIPLKKNGRVILTSLYAK